MLRVLRGLSKAEKLESCMRKVALAEKDIATVRGMISNALEKGYHVDVSGPYSFMKIVNPQEAKRVLSCYLNSQANLGEIETMIKYLPILEEEKSITD